ncbi:MAG: hypothetical protein K6F11_08155 [Lachnospiraceae bacterium]|nr:hypothetical protein [Lachnospiraceae bacterium]
MTRDEAKKFLTNLSWSVGTTAMEYWGDETGRKIREAVKAFEQESVLDKIRAEIMKLDDINPDYPMDMTVHISRYAVLQIIDKYKAESREGAEE